MSKFLSALNHPVVWSVYEKSLIVLLVVIAFGVVGVPIQLLAVVPPLSRQQSEEKLDGETASETTRANELA